MIVQLRVRLAKGGRAGFPVCISLNMLRMLRATKKGVSPSVKKKKKRQSQRQPMRLQCVMAHYARHSADIETIIELVGGELIS